MNFLLLLNNSPFQFYEFIDSSSIAIESHRVASPSDFREIVFFFRAFVDLVQAGRRQGRASERGADLTELPLDQSLRVVIGAQVSSINRTPTVGEAISLGYRNVS